MPYARKYKKNYKSNYKSSYKVSPAVAKYVNTQIHKNIENKYYATVLPTYFDTIDSNSWSERDLLPITQGTGGSGRVGRSVNVRSILIDAIIFGGAAETAADDYFNNLRVILGIYDGSDPDPLDNAVATLNSPIMRNIDMKANLIRKLLDKSYGFSVASIENGAGDGYTPTHVHLKYYKRFKKPFPITWNDDGNVSPDKRIILSMLSDSAIVPNVAVTMGRAIVTYEDA